MTEYAAEFFYFYKIVFAKPYLEMIMYWTCYIDNQDGKIHFFTEVYGRDKKVLHELKRER